MGYQDIDPKRASELLGTDPGYVYLDVRTVEEFRAGHAPGALNVPIAHVNARGMEPNAEFLVVVQAHVPQDTPLLVGCKMGGRSARACEVLVAAGYTRLHNVDGGFSGRPDGANEAIRAGWQRSGLPTQQSPVAGDYALLLARVRGNG